MGGCFFCGKESTYCKFVDRIYFLKCGVPYCLAVKEEDWNILLLSFEAIYLLPAGFCTVAEDYERIREQKQNEPCVNFSSSHKLVCKANTKIAHHLVFQARHSHLCIELSTSLKKPFIISFPVLFNKIFFVFIPFSIYFSTMSFVLALYRNSMLEVLY